MKFPNRTDNLPRAFCGGTYGTLRADAMERGAFRNGIAPANRLFNIGFRLTQTGCRQQILKSVTPP